jgi:hypothetical protein
MLITDYRSEELHFAYCYHAYLRWQTHRLQCSPVLARLTADVLQALVKRFDIHILECESDPTEVRVLVSLKPEESVAGCASEL